MSIKRLGNRAFASITEVFGINEPRFIDELDIAPVSPVLDVFPFAREELSTPWTFQLEIVHGAADTTNQRISPFVNTDWTNVFEANRETTSSPLGLQVLGIQVGATVTSGTLGSLIIETTPTQGSSMTGQPRIPMLRAVGDTEGRVNYTLLLQPMPWNTIWTWRINFVSTDASTLRFTVLALAGEPGIIPKSGFGM